MKELLTLGVHELELLAGAVAEGRLAMPLSPFAVQRLLGRPPSDQLLQDLRAVLGSGPAGALRLAAHVMKAQPVAPELVWTGPDETQQLRSTSTVVEMMLHEAKQRVTLAGFVIVKGDEVFGSLAERMDAEPDLEVTLYLNVKWEKGVEPGARVTWFARDFREKVWPGKRLPVVYYDPRSLAEQGKDRTALHAKCVVIDGKKALVTSANFTPHAQLRNIELGVKLDDSRIAERIEAQFSGLVQRGLLLRLPET